MNERMKAILAQHKAGELNEQDAITRFGQLATELHATWSAADAKKNLNIPEFTGETDIVKVINELVHRTKPIRSSETCPPLIHEFMGVLKAFSRVHHLDADGVLIPSFEGKDKDISIALSTNQWVAVMAAIESYYQGTLVPTLERLQKAGTDPAKMAEHELLALGGIVIGRARLVDALVAAGIMNADAAEKVGMQSIEEMMKSVAS